MNNAWFGLRPDTLEMTARMQEANCGGRWAKFGDSASRQMAIARLHPAMRTGQEMARRRLPFRDPRTVARDIPGVLDVLFPRLTGGLVASLNREAFSFADVIPIPDELVDQSHLQKAMLFELAVARAEMILDGVEKPNWDDCLRVSTDRQRQHYDARIPVRLEQCDLDVAAHAASNLVTMLTSAQNQNPNMPLQRRPVIPGLGWIASGVGDFSLGSILVEVKNTDRNFVSGDFRQVLMYWLLRYSASIGKQDAVWSDCLLLNPRRNSGLLVNFDYLLQAASANSSRVELFELLRSIVGQDLDRL